MRRAVKRQTSLVDFRAPNEKGEAAPICSTKRDSNHGSFLLYSHIAPIREKDMTNAIVDSLPERFFVDTLRIATYDEFFAVGPPCMYWWQDPQKEEPWPAVKLAQRTAVRLWHGGIKLVRMGDYLVWCNSDPIQIGTVSYSNHELVNLKTVWVPDIASSLSQDLWLAWVMRNKITQDQLADLNSDS
jgi:hypothetical protein